MATTKGKLLTQDERVLCAKIVALKNVLVSQRAQALLLLDDGYTQVKSCELSSLTIGQLRYLLRLFKKKGINLFPAIEEKEETPISAPEPEPGVTRKDVKKEKKRKKKKKKKKDKKTPAKKTKNSKKKGKKKTAKSKKKTKKGKKKR